MRTARLPGSGATVLGFLTLLVWGCSNVPGKSRSGADGEDVPGTAPNGGSLGRLITLRCGVCHMIPSPEALPKSGWASFSSRKQEILRRAARDRSIDESLLPSVPELEAIRKYLIDRAPTQSQLVGPPTPMAVNSSRFVAGASTPRSGSSRPEGFTDVVVDVSRSQILLSDAVQGGIRIIDLAGDSVGFVSLGGVPARIEPEGESYWVALMESPKGGKILAVHLYGGDDEPVHVLEEGLLRPIRAYPYRAHGRFGMIVEEFGDPHRGLSFWDQSEESRAAPRTLVSQGGLVGSGIADLDGDGADDLVALLSEELEQLMVVERIGTAVPGTPRVIFKAHPSFGFDGLLLCDLDDDGLVDIVTINGDNYDIDSGPLKPYHGVRIFRNLGDLQFAKPQFLPFHGVIDVVAADFDLDGDRDLFVLSAFPDFRTRPYDSAVMFEQVGPLQFVPFSIAAARGSRWVAADAEDLDGDGDQDLVLVGAYSASTDADRRWSRLADAGAMTVLLLTNTTRTKEAVNVGR